MSLDIRRLDPTADAELYRISFAWLNRSPIWRQHTESVFGTLDEEEYMASRLDERRLDIGVYVDGRCLAKIALHLTAKNTYEVSLEADRSCPPLAIITAGLLIRDQLFGRYCAQLVYVWIPSWARGVIRIVEAVGFSADNVIMARGTARNRLIEWLRYSLRAADDQQE